MPHKRHQNPGGGGTLWYLTGFSQLSPPLLLHLQLLGEQSFLLRQLLNLFLYIQTQKQKCFLLFEKINKKTLNKTQLTHKQSNFSIFEGLVQSLQLLAVRLPEL